MTTVRFRRASLRSVSRPHGDVVRIRRVTPGRGGRCTCVRACEVNDSRSIYRRLTITQRLHTVRGRVGDSRDRLRSRPPRTLTASAAQEALTARTDGDCSESLCRRATSTLARTILHFDDRFGVHRLVQRTPACGSACGRIPSVGRSCVDRVRLACTDVIFFIFMSSRLTMRRHHGKLHTLAQ